MQVKNHSPVRAHTIIQRLTRGKKLAVRLLIYQYFLHFAVPENIQIHVLPPQKGLELFPDGLGDRGGGCWKKSLLWGRFRYYLELNCHFMILPSMTSLALVLGRAVHIILINATRRLEIVTISEIKIIITNIWTHVQVFPWNIFSSSHLQTVLTGKEKLGKTPYSSTSKPNITFSLW